MYISGREELMNKIIENYDKYIIFMFTAKWCGPCKYMKSQFEGGWCEKNNNCAVLYIDVDDEKNEDLVNEFSIESMPTLIVNKIDNEKLVKLGIVIGSDMGELEKLIK